MSSTWRQREGKTPFSWLSNVCQRHLDLKNTEIFSPEENPRSAKHLNVTVLINQRQSDFYFRPEFKVCPMPGLRESKVFLPWHWRAKPAGETHERLVQLQISEWMTLSHPANFTATAQKQSSALNESASPETWHSSSPKIMADMYFISAAHPGTEKILHVYGDINIYIYIYTHTRSVLSFFFNAHLKRKLMKDKD